MRILAKKTLISLKNEGVIITARKCKNYVWDYVGGKSREKREQYVDVLFINGCALPHPARYRVSHQAEQLLMANMTSRTVYWEDLDQSLVRHARVFIFFRCPHTDAIEQFIVKAKSYHKTVIFDIDDLVFDRRYTDTVQYVQNMNESDKQLYNSGVDRIGRTLALCDLATTTTEALANELLQYVKVVYINRNVASDIMLALSEEAMCTFENSGNVVSVKKQKGHRHRYISKKPGQISLGYFSGSITHNDDFAILLDPIQRLMDENKQVHLYLVGELDLPQCLARFADRIHALDFMDWTKLPFAIAQMDVNLAPLEDTLFNRAKSENKWVEAALVKVITIASDVGSFNKMIQDGVTGVLCENTETAWYEKLKSVVENSLCREKIAKAAYEYVKRECITIETSCDYAEFIKSRMSNNIMFTIPTAQISGGILVAQQHAYCLQKQGIDVSFIHDGGEKIDFFAYMDSEFPVLRSRSVAFFGSIDIAVATLYTTMGFVQNYPNIRKRLYLVQGLETMFPSPGAWNRILASQAYMPIGDVKFYTISKWCQKWLNEKYHVNAQYVPNGINCELFYPEERNYSGKIRILIEGNSDDSNKNVDESFRIVESLDRGKYEIWYISYQGKAKEWYYFNRFFRRIPNQEMPKLYRKCHILLKSSILESFSYPPLEMMATGGITVVRPNEGNREYLMNEYNCLFYDPNQLETAVSQIERVVNDNRLREQLFKNGIKTAKSREWTELEKEITRLYTG